MLFGQIFGIIIAILIVAYFLFARKSIEIKPSDFVVAILGIGIGLSLGALLSLPLARLEYPFGQWLPLIINIFSAAVVTTFFYNQRKKIVKGFNSFFETILKNISRKDFKEIDVTYSGGTLIDTSAIIDGRILEIVRVGFLDGNLIIPKFVLEELQKIADSSNDLRRTKGRRGLEILNELKKEKNVSVKIINTDFHSESDVDAKILRLAKQLKVKLMTVDYNLNRVAQIQNILVLNVNELNNALRPVVLPGEKLYIKLVQEGKDKDQGVGYLEDGTMVVVEGGHEYINDGKIEVSVTRVFQTVAGKMIFAIPETKRVHVLK